MSGHNKFSKIKHKKAATDAQKSKVFSKHASLIAMEAKQAGGDLQSPSLQAAIERARKDSMPKENIERAVSKGSGADAANLEEIIYEGYGPGGVALLIRAVTDNKNRTAPEVRSVFTKANLQLGTPGSAAWAFTKNNTDYTPITPIDLSDTDGEKLAQLIENLEELDDVQDVYTTADEIEPS
jgi:YebC/PmpR family DNA-binding regulatory protein